MNKRWGIVALIFTGILISYIDRTNLSIANTAIMQTFGLSPAAMGTLLSAFFWAYAIFHLPSRFVVGRFGVRGTDKSVSIQDVALNVFTGHNLPDGAEPTIDASATFVTSSAS